MRRGKVLGHVKLDTLLDVPFDSEAFALVIVLVEDIPHHPAALMESGDMLCQLSVGCDGAESVEALVVAV